MLKDIGIRKDAEAAELAEAEDKELSNNLESEEEEGGEQPTHNGVF